MNRSPPDVAGAAGGAVGTRLQEEQGGRWSPGESGSEAACLVAAAFDLGDSISCR